MYCSSCGFECAAGLSYCNRCGANLNPAALTTHVVQTPNLTKPIIALTAGTLGVSLGGLSLIFVAASELARMETGREPVMAIIVMGMITVLLISLMLARQLSRVISAAVQTKAAAPVQPQPAQFVPADRTARQVAAAPTTGFVKPSVTEHTTRTLTPSYKEPNM